MIYPGIDWYSYPPVKRKVPVSRMQSLNCRTFTTASSVHARRHGCALSNAGRWSGVTVSVPSLVTVTVTFVTVKWTVP
eukprot:2551628-Rhodomonas_salina.2